MNMNWIIIVVAFVGQYGIASRATRCERTCATVPIANGVPVAHLPLTFPSARRMSS